MLTTSELKILKQFHSKLEEVNECTPLIRPDNFEWDTSSVELRLCICIESHALSRMEQNHIKNIFENDIETAQDYLANRIKNTSNYLLKARYYHLLHVLSNRHRDILQAIENYKIALDILLVNDPDKNKYVDFQEILDIVIQLCLKFKYKIDELKEQINNYLISDNAYPRLKTWIIKSISTSNLFRVKELQHIITLCYNLSHTETEHRFIEINLQLGLALSTRLQDSKNQKIFNELLGDNDYKLLRTFDGNPENMPIPHQNCYHLINIIQYYKNSKNLEKRDRALLEYNSNKKQCKFLKISAPSDVERDSEKREALEYLLLSIISSSTNSIISELIHTVNLPIIPDELLERSRKEREKQIFLPFGSVKHDLNNNHKEITNDERFAFDVYSIYLSITVNLTIEIIMTCLMNRKLSYKKMERFLLTKSFFGEKLYITRNGIDHSYTWFSLIDIGLENFFNQCNLFLRRKTTDWRFTIDFLTLKFEGLLRDIVGLTNGVITKVEKNGDTSELLLDDLLRSKSLEIVFNRDDLNLFLFVFTNKGHNIRNYVAHSFYKPHDYTIQKAVMVLLCILRLAKFNYRR